MAGYDDLIMDHIKNARNYRALADASHNDNGHNPLCGDDIAVYVNLHGDRIAEVSFECTCCGISMASASIMTENVLGKRVSEARERLRAIINAVTAGTEPDAQTNDPAQYALLKTIQDFPTRARCAALPWATLEGALDNRDEPVSVP